MKFQFVCITFYMYVQFIICISPIIQILMRWSYTYVHTLVKHKPYSNGRNIKYKNGFYIKHKPKITEHMLSSTIFMFIHHLVCLFGIQCITFHISFMFKFEEKGEGDVKIF